MKNTIVKEIANVLDVSDKKALNIVETVFEEVKQGIARDENVTLRGFGSFHAIQKRERIGRNPKTGEDAVISARRVTTFKASKKFKAKVNNGDPFL
tara:strand:- start:117 stop:404 length:288 start_codon:yes stop_codon:yes gene_type:complete